MCYHCVRQTASLYQQVFHCHSGSVVSSTGRHQTATPYMPLVRQRREQRSPAMGVRCLDHSTTTAYSASHNNWCTGTLWNRIMTAQCEGMGEVGSARYEPALLPPCPSIRVLCYRNCQRSIHSHQQFKTSKTSLPWDHHTPYPLAVCSRSQDVPPVDVSPVDVPPVDVPKNINVRIYSLK